MSAAPALPPKRSCYVKCQELTSRAVLIRRPTAAQRRHFKARLYHPPDLIYDRHRCHDGRRIGRILRLDQFPMSGGGPGGLQASRVLRTGCHELRQEVIHIGPALKSAVHLPTKTTPSGFLCRTAPKQHEPAASPTSHWFGHPLLSVITQSGCVRRPRRSACGPQPFRRPRPCRRE